MKKFTTCWFYLYLFSLLTLHPSITIASENSGNPDFLSGYYARESNNSSAAETTKNNIYIKLYPDQWIAILYVPYPYAKSIDSGTINKVFEKVERKSESGSFTRSTYDLLDEAATVHVEKYNVVEDQFQFRCGSISPCAVRFYKTYLELVKNGIINEHIIKFDHIRE